MLKHGSLFSGIGGFDLGFERAGIETVWQVEIDAYCRGILAKNFPNAERVADIRTCGAANLARVDVLSGGFPCQDISTAGKGAGIAEGTRSGLWSEYARIIGELRPRYVVVENVAALLNRGMERVLGDLAALGYDAEWESIRASDLGAPHRRERIWIVSYPHRRFEGWRKFAQRRPNQRNSQLAGDGTQRNVANADAAGFSERCRTQPIQAAQPSAEHGGKVSDADRIGSGQIGTFAAADLGRRNSDDAGQICTPVADTNGGRFTVQGESSGRNRFAARSGQVVGDADEDRRRTSGPREAEGRPAGLFIHAGELPRSSQWTVEPDVGRVANGISARVDRLRGLGNAIIPQIAEYIGRLIVHDADG